MFVVLAVLLSSTKKSKLFTHFTIFSGLLVLNYVEFCNYNTSTYSISDTIFVFLLNTEYRLSVRVPHPSYRTVDGSVQSLL